MCRSAKNELAAPVPVEKTNAPLEGPSAVTLQETISQLAGTDHGLGDLSIQSLRGVTGLSAVDVHLGLIQFVR
ncbi:hypothetical protein EYF80_013084 [Liparis tanakae]|uniref:Uncharacterized protein n=1 Tax=Liparis tanakae TaxID=230148 RepID=A0A4Z2IH27_9TELE|nr:hypothetical protein EYF80_013084 [Liparis tanakae]